MNSEEGDEIGSGSGAILEKELMNEAERSGLSKKTDKESQEEFKVAAKETGAASATKEEAVKQESKQP